MYGVIRSEEKAGPDSREAADGYAKRGESTGRMKNRGEITVFLSLCILCVAALLCVMAESVRTAGSRYYFQTAVGGALDSLFSRYHRRLWQQYRVLGLPCESRQAAADQLRSYTEKYLEVENWYPMELESMDITEWTGIADQGGDYLAQEIVDYMKFGVWGNLELSPDDGGQFLRDISEAAAAGGLTEAYDAQTAEVQKLEQAVEKLADCVGRQEEYAAEIASRLAANDAAGFRAGASDFRKEAGRMDGLAANYERQAERLAEKLADTERTLTEAAESWQGNRAALFEEQMDPYHDYTDADGARRREILTQLETGKENLERLKQTEGLVREAEITWEEARQAARQEEKAAEESGGQAEKEAEGGGQTAAMDAELSLAAAAEHWSGYKRSGLKLEYREGDTEKKGLLEQVKKLAQNSLLELVLPADMQVSAGVIAAGALPSRRAAGRSVQAPGPVERVLIHEYCGHFFTNAVSEEKKQVQYELEYLLQGRQSDRDNLQETMTQLLLVRQGLNLIHILSDPVKRDEARGLAAGIVGVTGLAPLVEITACFIMCVWAMGEAVVDLRTLYAGGRVPLWKNQEDWKLSLEGLLKMGKEGDSPGRTESEKGCAYETYLKLLLFLTEHQDLQMRILDMMEMNLKRQEEGFSIDKCAYRLGITGRASGKHVFFALPIVEKYTGKAGAYPLEAPAERAY